MTKAKGKKSGKKINPQGGDALKAENAVTAESVALQSNKIVICKAQGCHDIATTQSHCRFHYLASWRKSKTKEAKKKGKELEAYLSDLSRKFPEEFLEKIRAEVDELIDRESRSEEASEDTSERSGGFFDGIEGGDDDMDTIIKGLKVEDY
jgi:hypothetical protein